MELANGAIISGLQLEMRNVLIVADEVYNDYGEELTITCGLNGVHSSGSLHYYGYAIDLRVNFFEKGKKNIVFNSLRSRLKQISPFYDLVFHDTHIHIEFDIIRYSKQKGL
jgi:hypothetical protein